MTLVRCSSRRSDNGVDSSASAVAGAFFFPFAIVPGERPLPHDGLNLPPRFHATSYNSLFSYACAAHTGLESIRRQQLCSFPASCPYAVQMCKVARRYRIAGLLWPVRRINAWPVHASCCDAENVQEDSAVRQVSQQVGWYKKFSP